MSFEIMGALALVPALPLAAAAAIGVGVARGALLSAGAALASLASVGWLGVKLGLSSEPQHWLACQLGPGFRIGSLDVSAGLGLDVTSLPLALAVGAIGAAIALVRRDRTRLDLAGQSLLLAAAQLMVLAQGFVLTLLAWSLASAASALILGRRAFSAPARAAELLLLAGAALLFWTYGGRWDDAYAPALRPRVVGVEPAGAAAPSGPIKPGELTLAALPGARVGLGAAELCAIDADGRRGGIGLDTRPCREIARSPFARLPLPAAVHDIHLYPGPGTNELLVSKLRVQPGKETTLALLGPTLDFRQLREQLTLPNLAHERGMRRALSASELWGLPALALALLVIVGAAALADRRFSHELQPGAPPHALAAACGLLAFGGTYLVTRLDSLLALTPGVATCGVAYGCAVGVRSAARALGEQRVPLQIVGAYGGLAFAGACMGAGASAVTFVALAATAGALFALSALRPGLRALAAFVLVAAPVLGLAAMLQRLLGDAASYVPAFVPCGFGIAIAALTALAVRRDYQRARRKTVPELAFPLLRWLASTPRSKLRWDDRVAEAATRLGRLLARVERALYAPAAAESER